MVGVDQRQQPGEQRERGEAGRQPPGRLVHPQPRPEGEAAGDLGKRGADIGESSHVPPWSGGAGKGRGSRTKTLPQEGGFSSQRKRGGPAGTPLPVSCLSERISKRSEARRVGKECVSTGRYRGA